MYAGSSTALFVSLTSTCRALNAGLRHFCTGVHVIELFCIVSRDDRQVYSSHALKAVTVWLSQRDFFIICVCVCVCEVTTWEILSADISLISHTGLTSQRTCAQRHIPLQNHIIQDKLSLFVKQSEIQTLINRGVVQVLLYLSCSGGGEHPLVFKMGGGECGA